MRHRRTSIPHLRPASLALLLFLTACGGDAGRTEAEAPHADEAAEREAEETGLVRLDSAALAIAEIRVGTVDSVAASGLAVTGAVTYDADRVSHVGPRTEGRIVALPADVGRRVRGGEVLAVLESPDVGQLRAARNEAAALLRIAAENHDRERRLEAQGISSRKELLEAEAELRRAEAALAGAGERLAALGAGGGTGGRFSLAAPFAGVVVARDASLGEMAAPADALFTVADLSRVWIELDVFERDLARVRTGLSVEVRTAAYPGRTFPGRIVRVGAAVDTAKRTVHARVEVPNADGALKPGMFADATIRVAGGGPAVAVVPREAVQEVEGRPSVFVPAGAGVFRAVPVEMGEGMDGGRVVVRSGVRPGAAIVVAGAFTLRAELARGELAGHGH